ncbi:hypothetical protein PV325_005632 [Microctonus aethiopoides]|nr:hypothetical protein PV325_005632 [Microctonus aethiopoides]
MSKIETPRTGHELTPLNEDRQVRIVINTNNQNGSSEAHQESSKEDDRATWSGKMQFFLSIIGYSVGLGNIWRFPYMCQQNGGGAFLIPFFLMLILEGVPLFLIELGLGQRMRQGALGVWNNIHPWLGGIGITSCVVTFFDTLMWANCPTNATTGKAVDECAKSSSTAYFWYRVTLDAAPSIEDGQELKWWIVLCLLISWLIVFFIVMKGIQSSGKVVYFTSVFPYIVLTVFFIRGITLKGAGTGLVHMYTPKVEKLLEPTVWLDAATQVFYSFGLAFGSLIAFGSYNKPQNNCVRDVILVSVCNAFTAVYASAVVFTILGFKAVSNVDKCLQNNRELLAANGFLMNNNTEAEYYQTTDFFNNNTTLSMNITLNTCNVTKELNNVAEGTGLAFILFAQAIVELPGAPFWSCIFFLMLLALGLGSQIGLLEGMLCVIFDIDLFKRIKKQYITAVVCIVCFFVGLIFCTGAGEYWLKLFDSFAGTIGLVVVALMEMIAVVFIYGHEKFTKDIEDMTGYRPGLYWQISWRFLAPLIMIGILGSSIFSMIVKKPQYSVWSATLGTTIPTDYPDWVLAIGVCIICIGIAPILIVFLLRRFQCVKFDVDIHQGSIRRIDTTVSTKEMIGDIDIDEYHDRLEDFPEEDEDDINSDDDNNTATKNLNAIATKQHRGRAFNMEVRWRLPPLKDKKITNLSSEKLHLNNNIMRNKIVTNEVMDYSQQKEISLNKNNVEDKDFIVKYQGNTYEISDFLKHHPGGRSALKAYKGLALDKILNDVPHSDAAFHLFQEFEINNKRAYDDIEKLIDWNAPLFGQVSSLADRYWEWVNLPVNRPLRLFKYDFMELLTITPWYMVPIVWIPISIYFFFLGSSEIISNSIGNSLINITLTFGCGLLHWTFLEYVLHKKIFHLKPPSDSKTLIAMHFLLHGLHHKAPFDNRRLVFPPVAGICIATVLYKWYQLFLPTVLLNIIVAGTMTGYLCYDMIHYYLHHGTPIAETYLYDMKRYHNYHHFSHHEQGFGISCKLWDYVFNTLIVLRQLKKAIVW